MGSVMGICNNAEGSLLKSGMGKDIDLEGGAPASIP